MKPITLPSGEYLIVDVPQDAKDFILCHEEHFIEISFVSKGMIHGRGIEPCNWQLIGRESEITEEVARGIVQWYGRGDGSVDEAGIGDVFWCYDDSEFCFDTALESLTSLSKREGMVNPVWLKRI